MTLTTKQRRQLVYLVVVGVGLGAALATAGPPRDVDYPWHVLIGDRVLATANPYAMPQWQLSPINSSWQSGQVAAEVLFSLTDRHFGWLASATWWRSFLSLCMLMVITAFTRILPATGMARADLRSHQPPPLVIASLRWAVWLLGSAVVIASAQERPALFSNLCYLGTGGFIAWLTSSPREPQHRADQPKVALAVAGMLLTWSWLHQGWLLALPWLLLALVLSRAPQGLRLLLMPTMLVPLVCGPHSWQAPVQAAHLAASAGQIVEWQPLPWTSWLWVAAVLIAILQGCVLVFIRCSRSLAVLGAVACLVLPAFSARYLVPLLLLNLGMLGMWVGRQSSNPASTTSIRASKKSVTLFALLTTVGILTGAGVSAKLSVQNSSASSLIATGRLASSAVCVSNHETIILATTYNQAGAALYGSSHPACAWPTPVWLVIDGRADVHGADFIADWLSVTGTGDLSRPAWQQAHANTAILPWDSALATSLAVAGWQAQSCADGMILWSEPAQ